MENVKDFDIQYIEMKVTDIEATKDFYGKLFGWKFTDWAPTYCSFDNAGVEGGFEQVDSVPGGGTLVVLYHRDLEKAYEAVKESGAKITKETFSFPGGKRFQFLDPSGNELSIWSDK